jgi:hypothetical protein
MHGRIPVLSLMEDYMVSVKVVAGNGTGGKFEVSTGAEAAGDLGELRFHGKLFGTEPFGRSIDVDQRDLQAMLQRADDAGFQRNDFVAALQKELDRNVREMGSEILDEQTLRALAK